MRARVDEDTVKKLMEDSQRDGVQRFVVGAVIRRNNKYLLLERSSTEFMGGLVELPSGAVEVGEDLLTALHREVWEETGLSIKAITGYVGSFDYVSGSGKRTRQFNFLVDVIPREVQVNPLEHRAHFFSDVADDAFGTLNVSSATRRVLRNAAAM